jgi:uncharacterized protein
MGFIGRYGPWAMIAGASEGTGASFARQLAAKGLNLILIARREAPLHTLASEIRAKSGMECITGSIDLSAPDAPARMGELASDREVGLLILNAGADLNGSALLELDIAIWNALAMRNVLSLMGACHHFGKAMARRGRGGIIICGSGACYGGLPGVAVYGATKAFDLVLGEALWAELKPHGVDVLNLIMGRTDTPAHRELMERKGIPFPSDCASPDEVAALGLERLPHGPVQNWGLHDEDAGYAGTSAAQRRERILAIASSSAALAGAR